jgi:two-component system cell cycle response regulator
MQQLSNPPPIAERGARVVLLRSETLLELGLLLERAGHEVLTLSSEERLFEVLAEDSADCLIIDCSLLDTHFELCRQIRAEQNSSHTPILLVSTHPEEAEVVAEGLLAGADDFITDPSRQAELLARVSVQIRNKYYHDALQRVRLERDGLRRDVQVDPLTGTLNRRTLERILRQQCELGEPFALLYFDIDHFKSVNDTHGHEVGDRVLKEFCRVLQRGTRRGDAIGRWGGEEFLGIVNVPSLEAARELANRHREAVAAIRFSDNVPEAVTVSVGVAAFSPEVRESADSLLRRADAALYDAKRAGRNRVWIADPPASLPPAAKNEPIEDEAGSISSNPPSTARRA